MLNKSLATMIATSAVVLCAGAAHAVTTAYTNQATFVSAAAGNLSGTQVADAVNWAQFDSSLGIANPNNGTIPYGSSMTTAAGEQVTVANSSGVTATPFTTYVEGQSNWQGSFANGTTILYNGSNLTTTLTFATALSGLGVDLQTLRGTTSGLAYTFTLSAYDASNNLLGTASNSGVSHGVATGTTYEGTVPFAGITSTTANISYVVISSTNNNNGFAIDTSLIYHSSIIGGGPPPATTPEPGTLALLGAGLVGLGLVRRHRKAA